MAYVRPTARTTAFGGYTKQTSTTATKQTTAPSGATQVTNKVSTQPSTGSVPMTDAQRARRRARISRGRLGRKARTTRR